MNKERILELADYIEQLPQAGHTGYEGPEQLPVQSFYMASYSCGTAACIAGHALRLWHDNHDYALTRWAAARILDIGPNVVGKHLFVPDGIDLTDVKPIEAARVLRELAHTGVVNWRDVSQRQARERQEAEANGEG